MVKVCLPSDSKQQSGGGFSFRRNFIKGLNYLPGYEYCDLIEDSDICLVASTSMVTRETIDNIKSSGKKLVTRIDGVPRNSRNRNTGTSRLKEFSQKADEVIWQCAWAKDYLGDFIGKEGTIIYNGVDTDIFNSSGEKYDFGDRDNVYLYSRFNRDENKRYEEIWYKFQLLFRENKNRKLILVGQFSPEQIEYSFDFFRGEKVDYLGVVTEQEQMAKIYRSCKYMFAPYFADCYSNTYLEGLMSGIELVDVSMTGGTPELLENFKKGREFNSLERMVMDYVDVFNEVLSK